MRIHRPTALYWLAQRIARTGWRLLAGLDVLGLHNIPASGPFLVIANHESNLDPILIQAVCPRAVFGMAKSSQFRAPVLGPLMPRFMAFPVRRYQTDPQAVRTALRLLSEGAGVAVYIEGERSWDGAMQAPRPGTVRLVLKAGVPVIPCGISGAYEAWPRWSSRPQFLPVRITFGAALTFPQIDDRRAREALVPATADRIMTELARLSAGHAVPAGA